MILIIILKLLIADNYTWSNGKGLTYDKVQLHFCRVNENTFGTITPDFKCKINQRTSQKNFQVLQLGFSSKIINDYSANVMTILLILGMYQQYLIFLKDFNLTTIYQNDFVKFENYKKSYETVTKHNKRFAEGKELFQMKIDEFSINSEISQLRAGASARLIAKSKRQYELPQDAQMPVNVSSLPEHFDWREQGKVSPVQNQVRNEIYI